MIMINYTEFICVNNHLKSCVPKNIYPYKTITCDNSEYSLNWFGTGYNKNDIVSMYGSKNSKTISNDNIALLKIISASKTGLILLYILIATISLLILLICYVIIFSNKCCKTYFIGTFWLFCCCGCCGKCYYDS